MKCTTRFSLRVNHENRKSEVLVNSRSFQIRKSLFYNKAFLQSLTKHNAHDGRKEKNGVLNFNVAKDNMIEILCRQIKTHTHTHTQSVTHTFIHTVHAYTKRHTEAADIREKIYHQVGAYTEINTSYIKKYIYVKTFECAQTHKKRKSCKVCPHLKLSLFLSLSLTHTHSQVSE